MKELGDAINESLSDSEQISEVVSRIKEGGYDIFLVLEATIGVSKQGDKSSDKTSLVTTLSTNPEFKINDQDLKFLKSLRIKIDEDKYDPDRTKEVLPPPIPKTPPVPGVQPTPADVQATMATATQNQNQQTPAPKVKEAFARLANAIEAHIGD